jgi:hypothetical protein
LGLRPQRSDGYDEFVTSSFLAQNEGARTFCRQAGHRSVVGGWKVVYMIGPHVITNPNPHLYTQSEELYLLVYPLNPTGSTTLGQLTLPSGYQPDCDPCFHPGIPLRFSYHDHVLTGAAGLGKNGTAADFKAPWKIILLMYNRDVA